MPLRTNHENDSSRPMNEGLRRQILWSLQSEEPLQYAAKGCPKAVFNATLNSHRFRRLFLVDVLPVSEMFSHCKFETLHVHPEQESSQPEAELIVEMLRVANAELTDRRNV